MAKGKKAADSSLFGVKYSYQSITPLNTKNSYANKVETR